MKNKVGIGLTYILRKTAIASSIALPLVFAGCEKNYAPKAYLEVNTKSGDAPLEVRMKVTGEDRNGVDDIKEYRLGINSEIVKSNSPIDITRTFENAGTVKVYGEVVDFEEEKNKTEITSVEVYRGPFIEQSVSLINDVEIKYSATLSKVDKAELKVKRDGSLISTEEISDIHPTGFDVERALTRKCKVGQ